MSLSSFIWHFQGKVRGSNHLSGALVIPSEEDSQTFNVNFASGDVFKLRARDVKDRQVWVDRIRAVAQMHDKALAAANPPHASQMMSPKIPPTPPGSKSQLQSNGEPSDALQNLSLSVLDAFGSVHDIVHQAEIKNDNLSKAIESLPMPCSEQQDRSNGNVGTYAGPRCLDEDMLMLKASSYAALLAVEQALSILQEYRESSHFMANRSDMLSAASNKSVAVASKEGSATPLLNSPIKKSLTGSTGHLEQLQSPNRSIPSGLNKTAATKLLSNSTTSLPIATPGLGLPNTSSSSNPSGAAGTASNTAAQALSSSSSSSWHTLPQQVGNGGRGKKNKFSAVSSGLKFVRALQMSPAKKSPSKRGDPHLGGQRSSINRSSSSQRHRELSTSSSGRDWISDTEFLSFIDQWRIYSD